jgi:hypothetical protein
MKENEARDMRAKKNSIDTVHDEYTSILLDYLYKTTIASAIFFTCVPGEALWWPPYYHDRNKSDLQSKRNL